jgi:hypothetical protein
MQDAGSKPSRSNRVSHLSKTWAANLLDRTGLLN